MVVFGQCFFKTFWQKSSFSTKAIVSNPPVDSNPKLNPPIPENRSNNFNIQNSFYTI
jgi:hypothetical protein